MTEPDYHNYDPEYDLDDECDPWCKICNPNQEDDDPSFIEDYDEEND